MQVVLDYLIPLVVGLVALLLWLFLGDVLKGKVEKMRIDLAELFKSIASACKKAADACFAAVKKCGKAIPTAVSRVRKEASAGITEVHKAVQNLMPKNGEPGSGGQSGSGGTTPPAPPSPTSTPVSNLVIFMMLVLAVFCTINFFFTQDITPDLISLSPQQMGKGIGLFMLWAIPAGFFIGELAGAFMVKHELRKAKAEKEAGTAGGSWTRYLPGGALFGGFLTLEVLAGARRSLAFLEESTLLGADTGDVVTAFLWLAMAIVLPLGIFVSGMYVEEAFSESRAIGSFIQGVARSIGSLLNALWRAGGPVIVLLLEAIAVIAVVAVTLVAMLAATIGLALAIVATTVGGVLCTIGRVVFGHVVRVMLRVALELGIGLPAAIAEWRDRRREQRLQSRANVRSLRGDRMDGTRMGVLLLVGISSVFANINCGGAAPSDATDDVVEFATIHARDVVTEAPDEATFDTVPNNKLVRAIFDQIRVVRVDEPKIHVCLADISASVRSGGLRREILTRCEQLVSEVSAEQGPETTGVVLPIVEAGVASDTAIEVFERKSTATRCVINPPLPEFQRNTVIIGKMGKLKKRFDALRDKCSSEVASAYTAAKEARASAQPDFIRRVQERFGNASRLRTDILGTLAYVREYLDREEQRLGAKFAATISVVSDLEDDANGCVYREGAIECPSGVTGTSHDLCTRVGVQCYAHQVRQSTLASRRGSGFATANRAQAEREEAWKQFALDALGFQNVFTFTAPTGVTEASPVSPPLPEGEQEGVPQPPKAATDDDGDDKPPPKQKPNDDPPPKPKKPKGTCSSIGTLKSLQPRLAAGSLGDEIFTYGYALGSCGPEKRPWEVVDMDRDDFRAKYIAPFLSRGAAFQDADPNAYRRVQSAW